MGDTGIDLINRDPNDLNCHIKVRFEDILGEPEGVRSNDCVWKNSYACFECGKNIIYKLLTLCCGICIALEWGCEFGALAFDHVWCWTPCMRDFTIAVGCWQKCWQTIISCCIVPVCEGCGSCLSQIKVAKG